MLNATNSQGLITDRGSSASLSPTLGYPGLIDSDGSEWQNSGGTGRAGEPSHSSVGQGQPKIESQPTHNPSCGSRCGGPIQTGFLFHPSEDIAGTAAQPQVNCFTAQPHLLALAVGNGPRGGGASSQSIYVCPAGLLAAAIPTSNALGSEVRL